MITYDKLWETMKKKQISQYRMIRYYGVSAGQLGRLKKNISIRRQRAVRTLPRCLRERKRCIPAYPGTNRKIHIRKSDLFSS